MIGRLFAHLPPQSQHLIKLKSFKRLIYFFNGESSHFVQYGIVFMKEMHQNRDLKTSFRDWWRSRIYICDSPSDWCSLMNEKNINLESSFGIWQTVISPILSTLLIVILQKYGLVSIDILLVSFKTLTCWCNVKFRQVVSRYTLYPRLPISTVKEFRVIFKWDNLSMVVDYLILLYFSFLFCFRIFKCRMYELIFRNVYFLLKTILKR